MSGVPGQKGWVGEVLSGHVLCAMGYSLLVTGMIAAPLTFMAAAGEPYRSWVAFVGSPAVFAGSVAVLSVLLYFTVQVTSSARCGRQPVALQREGARCLRRAPLLLAIGLASVSIAMLMARWALTHESLEILAGDANRREGLFVLGTGAGLCALLAAAAVTMRPVLAKRAMRLEEMCVSRCLLCGYDLAGLTGPCPECGREQEREA